MLSPFQKSPLSLSVQQSPYTLQASENAFPQLVNHSTALEKGLKAQMLYRLLEEKHGVYCPFPVSWLRPVSA